MRTFEVAAPEHETVVVRVVARLHEGELPLERVGAGGVGPWLPEDGRLGIDRVESGAHGHELDIARRIGVRRAGAAIGSDLPTGGALCVERDDREENSQDDGYEATHDSCLLYDSVERNRCLDVAWPLLV